MGLSLVNFFDGLLVDLAALEKGQTTIEEIIEDVKWQREYADQCGKL